MPAVSARRRRTFAAVLALLAIVMVTALPARAQQASPVTWSAGRALPAPDQNAEVPHTAVSADGRVMTVMWDRRDAVTTHWTIQSTTSTDGGQTWSTPVNVSIPTSPAYATALAASRDGSTLTAAWLQVGNVDWQVMTASSTDAGLTWSTPLLLSDPTQTAGHPSISSSSDGQQATVAWYEVDFNPGTDDLAIWTASTANAGAAWAPAGRVWSSGTVTAYVDPLVTGPATGASATVMWRANDDYLISTCTSVPCSTGTWLAPSQVATATGAVLPGNAIAASAQGGRIMAAENILIAPGVNATAVETSSDGGITWSAPQVISDPTDSTKDPQISLSADGSVAHVTWTTGPWSGVGVNTSTDFGSTWGQPQQVSPYATYQEPPVIASSDDGSIATIGWYAATGAGMDLLTTTTTTRGAEWSQVASPATGIYNDGAPALAMSASGAIQLAAWDRTLGGYSTVEVALGTFTGTSHSHPFTFTYQLADGRECGPISPQIVTIGALVELPEADAPCVDQPGGTIVGWTIPSPSGSRELGSPAHPFPPGMPVRVVDSQVFTAVTLEPVMSVEYDANVGLATACSASDGMDAPAAGRTQTTWVPRSIFEVARTPAQAPCQPAGFVLAGWNTEGDGSGESIAVAAPLPPAWQALPVNARRLFAVWKPHA